MSDNGEQWEASRKEAFDYMRMEIRLAKLALEEAKPGGFPGIEQELIKLTVFYLVVSKIPLIEDEKARHIVNLADLFHEVWESLPEETENEVA